MTISRVSAASHRDRVLRQREQLRAHTFPPHQRQPLYDRADQAATTEMLEEIHTMLRHLTGAGSEQSEQ